MIGRLKKRHGRGNRKLEQRHGGTKRRPTNGPHPIEAVEPETPTEAAQAEEDGKTAAPRVLPEPAEREEDGLAVLVGLFETADENDLDRSPNKGEEEEGRSDGSKTGTEQQFDTGRTTTNSNNASRMAEEEERKPSPAEEDRPVNLDRMFQATPTEYVNDSSFFLNTNEHTFEPQPASGIPAAEEGPSAPPAEDSLAELDKMFPATETENDNDYSLCLNRTGRTLERLQASRIVAAAAIEEGQSVPAAEEGGLVELDRMFQATQTECDDRSSFRFYQDESSDRSEEILEPQQGTKRVDPKALDAPATGDKAGIPTHATATGRNVQSNDDESEATHEQVAEHRPATTNPGASNIPPEEGSSVPMPEGSLEELDRLFRAASSDNDDSSSSSLDQDTPTDSYKCVPEWQEGTAGEAIGALDSPERRDETGMLAPTTGMASKLHSDNDEPQDKHEDQKEQEAEKGSSASEPIAGDSLKELDRLFSATPADDGDSPLGLENAVSKDSDGDIPERQDGSEKEVAGASDSEGSGDEAGSLTPAATIAPPSPKSIRRLRPDLFFYGVVVKIAGYTSPDNETIKRLLQKHGGDLETYETERVTHIIAQQLSVSNRGCWRCCGMVLLVVLFLS